MENIFSIIKDNKKITAIIIGPIIVGIIAGLAGIYTFHYQENKKRKQKQIERKERGKQILSAIINEVRQGVQRCEYYSSLIQQNNPQISFSHIYTVTWDSMINELFKYTDDFEYFDLLHSIYLNFDLVNFNMNSGRLDRGSAFAENKIEDMKKNLSKLEWKYNKYYEMNIPEGEMEKKDKNLSDENNVSLLANLRTEYSALIQYHSEMIRFRFYTLAFYLAAVGFIVGTNINALELYQKGLLLILISVPIWILELRTRCIIPNMMKRGREIEFLWLENNLTYPNDNIYSTFFCSLEKEKAKKEYSNRQSQKKLEISEEIPPFDTTHLKMFGCSLPMPKNRVIKKIINHGFALDFIYLFIILYGYNLDKSTLKSYIRCNIYIVIYFIVFLFILSSISYLLEYRNNRLK